MADEETRTEVPGKSDDGGPGLGRDLVKSLIETVEDTNQKLEFFETHLKDATDHYQYFGDQLHLNRKHMARLLARIEKLESQMDNIFPPTENCPKCSRKITKASGKCGFCGTKM
jgi:hypothetical protein